MILDFEEELTINTFKIPWLIWIQILVLLLLLILLYSFTLFSPDLSHNSSFPSSSSASPSPSLSPPPLLIKRSSQPYQVGGSQSIKGEISSKSTIRRRVVGSREEVTERESASSTSTSINYHPCHYFKLARLAFLKCLGLDSSPETSSSLNEQRQKR